MYKKNYTLLKKKFEEDGYIILSLFERKKLEILKKNLSILINNSYHKNSIKKYHNSYSINDTIHKGMINLEKKNHKYLAEIYDIISKSSDFYNLLLNKHILSIVKVLLGLPNNYNLLLNSTTIRMDPPGINKFTYGWHKDEHTNIPGSEFVQIWAPLFNNVTKKNGALEIAVNSHLTNAITNKTQVEKKKLGKNNRSSYKNTNIINDKFKKKSVNLNIGEVLIFKKNLIHRSGLAKSKSMRYACTCFYHDINKDDFRYFKIDRK